MAKPGRIEITAFRRRTVIATGGGPIDQPRNHDDSEGSEVVQRVVLEFEASDIRSTDDLMKLIEALLNGRKPDGKRCP